MLVYTGKAELRVATMKSRRDSFRAAVRETSKKLICFTINDCTRGAQPTPSFVELIAAIEASLVTAPPSIEEALAFTDAVLAAENEAATADSLIASAATH